ncbi:hypothetical protein [Cerasicoccus fimbriatus]|uniref:hypothetical protein n=1 Tax=Cerasicoccus fimbriatus TaxID=3014554 RepID=UPI0022B4EEB2|nr:hypothetical protein [Cerasicoccus sp. TK19100]
MMKRLPAICLLALCQFTFAKDYTLNINGQTYDIGLDQPETITLPDGAELVLDLKLKDQIEYTRPYYSFSHTNKLRPAFSEINEIVSQTNMATALGVMVLVQEYQGADPATLVDRMAEQLTKEEVNYGYTYQEEEMTRKIGDYTLVGKKVVTELKEDDDQWVREVLTVYNGEMGLLIITMIDETTNAGEKQIITDFWDTLKITLD